MVELLKNGFICYSQVNENDHKIIKAIEIWHKEYTSIFFNLLLIHFA